MSESMNQVEEENLDRNAAATLTTPLRQYVTMIGGKREKWTCNFKCKLEPYTGSYSRIRAHLIGLMPGQKAQGIALCSNVSQEDIAKMKSEEEDAKLLYGKKSPVPSLPMVTPMNKAGSTSAQVKSIGDLFNTYSGNDYLDDLIARFFYGCGIPFNVARSPFFVDMIRGINDGPKGYNAPSSEKIRTVLLDKEKSKLECALMGLKDQWPLFGISIVSDGWSNIRNQPLVNVLAISGGRAMFLQGIDCSGDEKTGAFIAEVLLKAIENVGVYNVVQVLTDNTSACKLAGELIMQRYPHIFWSGCMAHTLSLLVKDIAKSGHPSLLFYDMNYQKAKGIVKYIKTHSMITHIYRKYSELEVIQVKKTRFGHHYVVMERLLRVKRHLISLVLDDEWEKFKCGTSKSKFQHADFKRTVLDEHFWEELKAVIRVIKPIWKMICFCDSDKAIIGEVYQKMEDMLALVEFELRDKSEIREVVKSFISQRWGKMDAPLHLLAYVLTPHYYSDEWLNSLNPKGKKRKKPHFDPDVQMVYLNVVDRLMNSRDEASVVRGQLSYFISNTGAFDSPQSIQDRKTMTAIQWWNLYGAAAPELYSLAVKVLSQSVNSSCAERPWNTYGFIQNVTHNPLNTERAESLAFVHFNHRLLTRYRADYQSYKDWDANLEDDALDFDMTGVEDMEYGLLHEDLDSMVQQIMPSDVVGSSRRKHRVTTNSGSKRPRIS